MADDEMTPEEAGAIIDRLGWIDTLAAAHAKRDYRQFERQLSGREAIDDKLADWLRKLNKLALEYQRLLDNPPNIR